MEEENKPTFLITITVIFISLTIISLFINILCNKNNIENILINQNLSSLFIKDKELNKVLDDKKIPKEAITYINEEVLHDYLIIGIDRLYNGEMLLISENEVNTIIKNSINKYEKNKNIEVYSYINDDLKTTSKIISKGISNEDAINTFNIVKNSSNIYIVFMIISIICIVYLFIKSKREAFLYNGLIFMGASILNYYIINKLLINLIKNISFIEINKHLLGRVKQISLGVCSIIFVVGVILLVIYLVKYSQKLLRDFRIKYIYKY